MGKCLIKKLKQAISDSSLLKLNEVRFRIVGNNSGSSKIGANGLTALAIIGPATFSDGSTSKSIDATTAVGISNYSEGEETLLSVENKYALTSIEDYSSFHVDLEGFKYATNLCVLYASQLSGDLSALSNLSSLSRIGSWNSSAYSNVTGDISSISGESGIEVSINKNEGVITGDISRFAEVNNLVVSNSNFTGSISIDTVKEKGSLMVGGTFTWVPKTNSGKTYAPRLQDNSVRGVKMRIMNIDEFLIDIARLEKTYGFIGNINLSERTSASDEAYQALLNKGYSFVGCF